MSQYITNITENKRNQFKKMLDQFSTFTWNDLEGFEKFGAFIINENREGLKFYNGPSFSNEYTNPQFAKNKEFIGVNFEQQKISFKIGVYWISIEDYRRFLEWLNPYVIGKLHFTFAEEWDYQVKLAGREESTRYILGYENNEPRYYSEMTLNFEVQGEPCLYAHDEFKWKKEKIDQQDVYKIDTRYIHTSDLPVDLIMNFALKIKSSALTPTGTGTIEATICYNQNSSVTSKQLFKVSLKNLTVDNNSPYVINLDYSSKDGLLYLGFGSEKHKLLNLLTTTTSGKELVSSMSVNKVQLPGMFNNSKIKYENFYITLTLTGDLELNDNNDETSMDIQIHSRARTNII